MLSGKSEWGRFRKLASTGQKVEAECACLWREGDAARSEPLGQELEKRYPWICCYVALFAIGARLALNRKGIRHRDQRPATHLATIELRADSVCRESLLPLPAAANKT